MRSPRDIFREAVLNRDKHTCVVCQAPAVDAHHIMERRLFADGGYDIDNGASVCEPCHILAEQTTISPSTLRSLVGITRVVLPSHLYEEFTYDKWGNIIHPDETRSPGELFYDESVQKILTQGGVLNQFRHWTKYPRTHHLPWSNYETDDDRVLQTLEHLRTERIVVTEKMDGENTTMYQDYIHARSLDSPNHASRNWVKNLWSNIGYQIPLGWRVCGENLYARHSIPYIALPSYFLGFSVWNDRNECLSWPDTLEWFDLLGLHSVPVLYIGMYDPEYLMELTTRKWEHHEGYVVRVERKFSMREFKHVVGKYVRPGHIQTTKHWMHGQPITPNGLIP